MIPAVFGSVTPNWTGISPGLTWPGLGASSLSSVDSGPSTVPGGSYGLAGGFGQPAPWLGPGRRTARHSVRDPRRRHRSRAVGGDRDETRPASGPDQRAGRRRVHLRRPRAAVWRRRIEVRCEGGRVSLTGSVPHKRFKRDAGEIAWAIPGISDVNNTITITARRRSRAFSRETETPPSGQSRKQA